MIDFTSAKVRNKTYAGANGSKISVIYNNEQYMLKFPPLPTINKEMSYTNSCISECIGCKIFDSVGIPVQETVIETYTSIGREKIVVACKDFTSPGITLQDFASLKNRIIDSGRNGYGTELHDILATIDEQTSMGSDAIKTRFWDTFKDIQVKLQAMGGGDALKVKKVIERDIPCVPVSFDDGDIHHIYKQENSDFKGYTNFFRQDHYRMTAYYYIKSIN